MMSRQSQRGYQTEKRLDTVVGFSLGYSTSLNSPKFNKTPRQCKSYIGGEQINNCVSQLNCD